MVAQEMKYIEVGGSQVLLQSLLGSERSAGKSCFCQDFGNWKYTSKRE